MDASWLSCWLSSETFFPILQKHCSKLSWDLNFFGWLARMVASHSKLAVLLWRPGIEPRVGLAQYDLCFISQVLDNDNISLWALKKHFHMWTVQSINQYVYQNTCETYLEKKKGHPQLKTYIMCLVFETLTSFWHILYWRQLINLLHIERLIIQLWMNNTSCVIIISSWAHGIITVILSGVEITELMLLVATDKWQMAKYAGPRKKPWGTPHYLLVLAVGDKENSAGQIWF